jgi:uncharacterized membrane protein YfcA
MDIYLPIAEVTANVALLLLLGLSVGFLSGMLGVSGGFLLTPLLIFIGIPQPIAVGSSANELVGASLTGVIGHLRRRNVDYAIGTVLVAGGSFGSWAGVTLFGWLSRVGQIDLVMSLGYVILLGTIGTLMLVESVGAVLRARQPAARMRRLHAHSWVHRLPFKVRFRRSKLYVSALLPLGIGFGIGVISALLGVGGGFLLVPTLFYVLGMPASLVPGTSLFQTVFIAAVTTALQATLNHTVDAVLALLVLAGATIGVQYGGRLAVRVRSDYLRVLLSLVILAVGTKLLYDVTAAPENLYSIRPMPQ